MAIDTQDKLVAGLAGGQTVLFNKASRASAASVWFSTFDLAGQPGAGTLAGASVTAGVVPTDLTPGCPVINAFSGVNLGYLASFDFGSTVPSRLRLADMVFKAGAFPFNAAQALTAQPSYASRMPGGTDFKGTELWLEAVTAFTGLQSVAVTYTNQDGVAGRTTGTVATGVAPTVGRMLQLPLQAGDNGVQSVQNVTSTVATAGTFNVLVLRPLLTGRVRVANDGDIHGPDKTNLELVTADAALILQVASDAAATGVPDLQVRVVNG